jgi:hypothetical protein
MYQAVARDATAFPTARLDQMKVDSVFLWMVND